MKNYMKIIGAGLAGLAIGTMAIGGFAAPKTSGYQNAANMMNRPAIVQRVDSNKAYDANTLDPDKLKEYRQDMLDAKKAELDVLVKKGRITQAEADAILKNMEENQAYCDENGYGMMGRGMMGRGMMGRGMMGQGGHCGRGVNNN